MSLCNARGRGHGSIQHILRRCKRQEAVWQAYKLFTMPLLRIWGVCDGIDEPVVNTINTCVHGEVWKHDGVDREPAIVSVET